MLKTLSFFSLLCRLPKCFLLKIFLAVSDSCMPAWPIWCYFLDISQYCLYSKLWVNILKHFFLHSPCNGHPTMITWSPTELWWARHLDMRMPWGSQAVVWITDTVIHPPHKLSSAESWCCKHGFTAHTVAGFQDSHGRRNGSAGILRNSDTSTSWEYVSSRGPCDVWIISLWCVKSHGLPYKNSILLWIHD